MSKIIIYREVFNIPDFPQSFSDLEINSKKPDIVDVGGVGESEDIDKLLTEKAEEGKRLNPDLVIIPSIIGMGIPLSYYGIRLAMHWRLDTNKSELNNIPIVIYGIEEEANFFWNCEYCEFLKTPNVFYIQYSEEAILNFFTNFKLKEFENRDFRKSYQYYKIEPPDSYTSSHSIVNEWSILKWAEALGINDERVDKIEGYIRHSLYYKFLKVKHSLEEEIQDEADKDNQDKNPVTGPAESSAKPKESSIIEDGVVLYIDDEVEKGWSVIFNHIIKKDFHPFGSEFKNWPQKEIVDKSLEKVKEINPDVVILDLRLHDDDFPEDEIKKLTSEPTGLQILKKIKLFNKGIQVIIFSATNKIWNLIELQKEGANGFIMKEAPESSADRSFTDKSIKNIYSQINDGMKMKFLKGIVEKIDRIKELIETQDKEGISEELKEFYNRTKTNLDIACDLIDRSRRDPKYNNYGFLQLFQIIEDFVKLKEVFEEGDKCYVMNKEKKIFVLELTSKNGNGSKWKSVYERIDSSYFLKNEETSLTFRYVDTYFKVSSILIFRNGFKDSNIKKWNWINSLRNTKVGHGGNNKSIKGKEIIPILDFLIFILDDNNIKDTNIEKGLKTMEEKLIELQNKSTKT